MPSILRVRVKYTLTPFEGDSMRFYYPHRLYMTGLILLLFLLVYGLIILNDISLEGNLPKVFLPFYSMVCLLFSRFYYKFYLYYRDKFIDVYMEHIEFCSHGQCVHIKEEDILGIYLAKHRQMMKIHKIVHIFTKDGTYIHVTNEVNKYNRFISLLKFYYPNKFKVCKHIVSGVHDINMDLLERHYR